MDISQIISSTMEDIANKNYWLVRTYSGEYYTQFNEFDFIGIGWNEILLDDINKLSFETPTKELKLKRKASLNQLASKVFIPVGSNYDSAESQFRYAIKSLHQVETFIKKIKKGDVIIIPSANSDYYSFGEVMETPVYLATNLEMANTNCQLIKRKKIHWIKKNVSRLSLDANYYKFIRVQSTISNISDYAYFIEKTISYIFINDGKSNFVFNVTRKDEIYISHYAAIIDLLDITTKAIGKYSGEEVISESEIKANVQSPGDIIVISDLLTNPYWISLVIFALCGGGLAIDHLKMKFGSTGIVRTISSIFDGIQSRKNQDTIRRKIEELDSKAFLKSEKMVAYLLNSEKEKNSTPGGNDVV